MILPLLLLHCCCCFAFFNCSCCYWRCLLMTRIHSSVSVVEGRCVTVAIIRIMNANKKFNCFYWKSKINIQITTAGNKRHKQKCICILMFVFMCVCVLAWHFAAGKQIMYYKLLQMLENDEWAKRRKRNAYNMPAGVRKICKWVLLLIGNSIEKALSASFKKLQQFKFVYIWRVHT